MLSTLTNAGKVWAFLPLLLWVLLGNIAQAATLDTVPTAVKKILVVSADHSSKARVNLLNAQNQAQGFVFEHIKLPRQQDGTSLQALADGYDLVIFSAVSEKFAKEKFIRFLPVPADFDTPLVAVPWSADNPLNHALTATQAESISRYYRNGGPENMRRLGTYLDAILFAGSPMAVLPPIDYPKQGIYHPDYQDKILPNLQAYLQWRGLQAAPTDRPVIGLMMRLEHFGAGRNVVVDELITRLEQQGAFVIPFYIAEYETDYQPLITQQGQTVVHNIINLRTMHSPNKRRRQFEKLGVPVLHAIQYYDGDTVEWEVDTQGVSPMMTPFMMSMPESAGVIDITTVAASPRKTEIIEVLEPQLEAIAQRALGQAKLVFKDNAAKKLTMMVWNYPGGEKNIGASFLNIPRSIREITQTLANNGYQVSVAEEDKLLEDVTRILRPFYRDYELQGLLDNDLAELMPVAAYQQYLNGLPATIREAINKDWGEPENGSMVVEREGKKYFVMPRIRLGNMIIMRQPPRGDQHDKEKSLYHDKTITVNHYYLAAYYYAREVFASDALIHLGTHGSQEYLPGKERSLSVYDSAILPLANTPVVYPFIVDDVGEAVQAKRRGRATIISHMTPPFAAAGLYAESMDLHELMHQYNSMIEGAAKKLTLEKIITICVQNNYCADIAWSQDKATQQPEEFLLALHDYLGELAAESQPLGLHTFGKSPEQQHIITSIIQMLGTEFTELAINYEAEQFGDSGALGHQRAHSSLVHTHADGSSHSHAGDDQPHQHDDANIPGLANKAPLPAATESVAAVAHVVVEGLPERGEKLESIPGYLLLEKFLLGEGMQAVVDNEALQPHVDKARHYFQQFHQLAELNSLLRALDGKHVKVTTGGDPIRNPEVVPTGYNLYGFDPSKVPTQAAWEAGSKLTEDLIADYYQQHGKYPAKMAFSMWSIETMRHFGVLEAQVLRAMGVRPIWSDDGRIQGTEIIPYAELKRPRVDVVLSATGLYRDAFPNIMEWMAEAIAKVARLKEEGNALYQHAQAMQQQLQAEGMDAEEAEYLSTVRIFSNKSGSYGSGLGGSVMESGTWEQDDKLAKVYLDKMGYYFGTKRGPGKGHWGQKLEDTDLYAKTLSGTDLAVFSRTSNLYGLLTSDDPFQYLGGISLAVRNLDGKSPQLYISNLRDANNNRSETIQKFMAKELRNRSFHPRWVESMQDEGYSGALAMLDNLNNFWGWQVTAPESVREDQWQEFFEVYIEDKYELNLEEWFEQANNHTKAQMLERMLEAVRKDYWEAAPETLQKMVTEYVEQASQFDYQTSNDQFVEYLQAQAQGYGLDSTAITVPPPPGTVVEPPPATEQPPQPTEAPTQNVEGMKLEQQPQQTADSEWDYWYWATILLFMLAFAAGALRRVRLAN